MAHQLISGAVERRLVARSDIWRLKSAQRRPHEWLVTTSNRAFWKVDLENSS